MNNKTRFFLFLIGLLVFRIIYGLFSEFWLEDELQVYLIGLKSFTTNTWPFYGPDVVYKSSQIPGALQGLLVSIPLYLLKIPESPVIFINLLSFASLAFFAYYVTIRITGIPKWVIWTWLLTSPWTLYYSTRVVNPSYVIIFSVPFFISIFEILSIYQKPILNKGFAFFIVGITTTLIMQLHMSWVLLVPFTLLAFAFCLKSEITGIISYIIYYISGLLIGALTLIPTLINPVLNSGHVGSNIEFNIHNISNVVIILLRFLSFASFEISFILGGSISGRLAVVKDQLWMSPVVIFLLFTGFAQILLFILAFFRKEKNEEWKKIKWFTFLSFILIFISFFFSVKGPSSHTFIIMLPVSMFYSFYCYQWLFKQNLFWLKLFKIALICGIIFHIGMDLHNYKTISLYKNRKQVQEAIDKRDYKILGLRRSEHWGYGY
jgi:hypothetical protein